MEVQLPDLFIMTDRPTNQLTRFMFWQNFSLFGSIQQRFLKTLYLIYKIFFFFHARPTKDFQKLSILQICLGAKRPLRITLPLRPPYVRNSQ